MSLSPLSLTRRKFTDANIPCDIVERFVDNPHVPAKYRSDLFGLFDLVAMSLQDGIIGIQCCGTDLQPHIKKATELKAKNAYIWLSSGARIQIWSWRLLLVKRGGKARRWVPRVVELTMDDLKITPIIRGLIERQANNKLL